MTAKKVAIIGGGLSGLFFAYYLSKIGHKVTLFEKESSLGGELATLEIGGTWPIEKFYHHVFSGCPETKKLLTELDISNKLKFHESKIGIFKNNQLYPFNSPLDLMKLDFLDFITKIRMGLGSISISHLKKWQKLEDSTAESLIKKIMGNPAWQEFWEPMFNHKFGKYAHKVGAVWFWSRLTERLVAAKKGESLGYVEGSFQVLCDALASSIKKANGIIKTKKLITNIVQKGDWFQIDGRIYDVVVSAIPQPSFFKIAPTGTQLNSEPSTKDGPLSNEILKVPTKHMDVLTVLLELKRPLSDYYWINILDKKLPFVVMIEHTNLISAQKYNSHLLYLGRYIEKESELYQKTDPEIIKIFLDGLEKISPGAKKLVKKSHLFRDDNAQPLIETNYKKPDFKTKINNLYWFSAAHIYPGDRGIENIIKTTKELVDLI